MDILTAAKTALRITTDAFDGEIKDLIDAARFDLQVTDIINSNPNDPLVRRAVITYVRLHFGQPDDYDRLKASYDEQKAQLSMCSGYTGWANG